MKLTEEQKLTPPEIEVNFIPKETTVPSNNNYKVHYK